jgi:hypothetical protein
MKKYNINHPNYKFYKLLLNGLYGYFGRKPYNIISKIVNEEEKRDIISYYDIKNIIELNKNSYFIQYYNNINSKSLINYLNNHNNFFPITKLNLTNIAIASAITSYSRIEMYKYINKYNVYYLDTDSIFIDQKLPENIVDNEIGHFKLVDKIKEIYFISNKFYAYKNHLNNIIIKSAGIPNNLITYQDYIDLYNNIPKTFTYKLIQSNLYNFSIYEINKNFTKIK